MERDQYLLNTRPNLKTIQNSTDTSTIELLQNDALRPILKTQNNLLVSLFSSFLNVHRQDFGALKKEEQEQFISNLLKNQLAFRNQLIGCIIGMLTINEFAVYTQNTTEYNRRIVAMAKSRILSNFE
jgi:hypothetical protein